MGIAETLRKKLEGIGDYPIKSNTAWFAVFPDKLNRLLRLSAKNNSGDLHLIVYKTTRDIERDHYYIPFQSVWHLFKENFLTHSQVNGSIRWNCTLDKGRLHITNSGEFFNVAEFYGATLPGEALREALPQELSTAVDYVEGRVTSILVNRYERDPNARSACIDLQGSSCVICGFSFGKFYGPSMKGFIHVHHIHPLHLSDPQRNIDPRKDLIPVCPNCHAVIHSRKTILNPSEVALLINTKKSEQNA